MAYLGARTGPATAIDRARESCPNRVYWTIQVKNGHPNVAVALGNTAVQVTVGVNAPTNVTTDAAGNLTLEFDPGENLAGVQVDVVHAANGWSGRAGAATASGANLFQSAATLRGTWRLRVRVVDLRPLGVAGDAIPLGGIRVNLRQLAVVWGGAATGDTGADGAAFAKDDNPCQKGLGIRLASAVGEIATDSAAAVSVNGHAVDLSAPAVHDGASVSRDAPTNEVRVTVERHDTLVEIELRLRFPKVFVVGEGPAFPYAIGLATRFNVGRPRALPPRANGQAPDTQLATVRKWVFASQYDVHAPPDVLPDNLVVYRDAVLTDDEGHAGRFDVRTAACWARLTAAHGEFDAIVFNNPHPGYGMHLCNVFGVTMAHPYGARNGKYISVHSVGCGTLSDQQVQTFRGLLNQGAAAVQRHFLRTTVGCRRDGTDTLFNWRDDGGTDAIRVEPSAPPVHGEIVAFRPQAQADVAFADRETHYDSIRNTTGLWASVLRCYRANGVGALRRGGEIYVNGSTQFQSAIDNGHLAGFADAGVWSTHGTYYANYRTNFTSDLIHPSHFAKNNFVAREPNLADAHAYRYVKP